MSRTYHHHDARTDWRRPESQRGYPRRYEEGRRRGDEFRCHHCKLMVGPVPSGGRQRNHCPNCLYSRHVDRKTPGDRASDCGALMAPIGAFARPNGEQVLVHYCGGCGSVRYNHVAADDNYAAIMRLPFVPPPTFAAAKRRAAG